MKIKKYQTVKIVVHKWQMHKIWDLLTLMEYSIIKYKVLCDNSNKKLEPYHTFNKDIVIKMIKINNNQKTSMPEIKSFNN